MIQRIQSIFLLITAILMAVTVFSPLGNLNGTELNGTLLFLSYGIQSANEIVTLTPGIVILASLGAILPLINIFLYKNRKLQIKLGNITALIIVFFYVTVYTYIYSITGSQPMVFGGIEYGIILPLIALIFNILAILSIKKDEKLVQSLSRIR